MAHRLPKDAGDESGESSITLDDGGANVQASTTGITTTTGASTREKEYVESSREDLKAEDVEEKRSIEEAAPSAPPAMDYPEGGWRACAFLSFSFSEFLKDECLLIARIYNTVQTCRLLEGASACSRRLD